jgi:hypothetical protein
LIVLTFLYFSLTYGSDDPPPPNSALSLASKLRAPRTCTDNPDQRVQLCENR